LIGGHSGHYGKETGRGSCHTVTNQRQTDKRLAGHATVLMSTLRCQQSSKFIGQIIDSHYAEKQPNTRLQKAHKQMHNAVQGFAGASVI